MMSDPIKLAVPCDPSYGHSTSAAALAQSELDPSRAAHLRHEALGVARQTGSARIQRELRTLDAELLERWPGDSEARIFHEALVSV